MKPFDNWILLDESIFEEPIAFTAINPFAKPSRFAPLIETAAQNEMLYGLSPYTSYAMKKLAPSLWSRAFRSIPAQKNLYCYQSLSEPEKITVDFLQSLYFLEKVKEYEEYFSRSEREYPVQPKQRTFFQKLGNHSSFSRKSGLVGCCLLWWGFLKFARPVDLTSIFFTRRKRRRLR